MIKLDKKKRRLVVVSNRLPFFKVRDEKGKYVWKEATGGLITSLDPVLRKTHGIWLGWDGAWQEKVSRTKFKLLDVNKIGTGSRLHGKVEGSYSIGSIPINSKEIEEYYNKVSNGTIWSLFHYFFEKSSIDYNSWQTYYEVNKRFANYVAEVASKDDIVWVQDFHLFLVPFFLRKMRPKQQIHFFLHIPFPHIDIFSILPWQDQILESLLCCNSAGFHHRQYLRNCLEAVELYKREKRSTGKKTVEEKVPTRFYVNPISIDYEKFDKVSRKAGVIERSDEIRKLSGCPKIVLGVDRMDYSKGIKERLLGIEKFLIDYPELVGKFAYYQVAVPSREDVFAYKFLKKEIDEIVGRINGRFATGTWSPIHYIYKAVPFEELVAIYLSADVGLVTPLRDGMNLVSKEYIAAHSDGDGVLILSKFAGAISEIKNCLAVNPYSIEDISNAIYKALNMPKEERKRRMSKMRRNVKANNIKFWLNNCFKYFEESLK